MPNPTLTVNSGTTLQQLQEFSQNVQEAGHGQIRAKQVGKEKDGTPIYQLYSKSSSSVGSKLFGWNKDDQESKSKNAKAAIAQVFKNTVGGDFADTVLGSIFQRRLPSGSTTMGAAHLESLMQGLQDTQYPTISTHSRHQVMVGMGQGAVGPLNQLQFYSDSFQSCAPLVMWNSHTGMGGLFHIPAFSDGEMPEDMQKVIGDMLDRVKPTNVEIYRGNDVESGALDIYPLEADRARRAMLEQEEGTESILATMCSDRGLGATISKSQTGVESILVTRDDHGGVRIESGSDSREFGHKGLTNAAKDQVPPDNVMLVDMKVENARDGLVPDLSRMW